MAMKISLPKNAFEAIKEHIDMCQTDHFQLHFWNDFEGSTQESRRYVLCAKYIDTGLIHAGEAGDISAEASDLDGILACFPEFYSVEWGMANKYILDRLGEILKDCIPESIFGIDYGLWDIDDLEERLADLFDPPIPFE